MPPPVKAWSFSRLVDYETCPYKLQLKVVDRVPEPERPLPPGRTEHPLDRGTRVHKAAEDYITGSIELVSELAPFASEFDRLKALYQGGQVSLEGEWAYDKDWNPTSWMSDSAWARIKLDALVHLTPTHGVVLDYKTGKKVGNEVKHADQMQLYQLSAFMRYPKLEKITIELWYTDQDAISRMDFSRDQGLRFFKNFDDRARKMTSDEELRPRPNKFVCGRCPYKDVCEFSAAGVVQKRKDGGFKSWG